MNAGTDADARRLAELFRGPLDPLLTDPTRLRLAAALHGLPAGDGIAFTALRKLLGLTDGNLGMHLRTLAEIGYVDSRHVRPSARRQTVYALTTAGRAAFARHVEALEAIIRAARQPPSDQEPAL